MIPKLIDAHVHLNSAAFEKTIKEAGIHRSFLSINTDIPFFMSLDQQREISSSLFKQFPGQVRFIATFSLNDLEMPEWSMRAISQINQGLKKGAAGVKFWKNIGMDLMDKAGNFIMIDHPKFDPIFDYLEENEILAIGHLGEPKNCWLPHSEMIVDSDREYYSLHPEYHMYLHPEYPSYKCQIQARDNRLRKHPKLKFVGLHLASLEWNIRVIAIWLDRFPQAMTDLAERICHLQYQSINHRDKVRNFIIKYQDRIIYGTDFISDGSLTPHQAYQKLISLWEFHWKFFASEEELQAPEFRGTFRGLALDDEVLHKIFVLNAQRTYGFS